MDKYKKALRSVFVLGLIYLFLVSIEFIGKGAGLLGAGFARHLISTTSDPVIGLFIGILVTVVVQSSSLTTSLVVALVGGGIMNLQCAVPIIMGANVGTTVTNAIVSLGHISWRNEFKRAFAAATVHDIFNILTLIIVFPLELKFHYLTKIALLLQRVFENIGGFHFTSPIKVLLAPPIKFFKFFLLQVLSLSEKISGSLIIILGLLFLFMSLIILVKILRKMFIGEAELLIDKYIFRTSLLAMFIGFVITAIVQSSSLTTSVIVPLAAAGIVGLERIFPYTLGANVGTTFTALLASLAVSGEGRAAALAAALAHLCFNLTGIAIFYPFRFMRRIPVYLAEKLSAQCAKRRYFALIFVLTVFVVIPLTVIFLEKTVWR